MKDLKYIDDSAMCLRRSKRGKGYVFLDEHNEKITNPTILKRVKQLVIPPMWNDVMICKFDDGHIQAIGRDLKGRKQYIYHDSWVKQQQEEKFNRLLEFGNAIPQMREKCHSDILKRGWHKEKVLALMVLILDECGIRIGNKQYATRNGTFGLTTLRRKHLTIDHGEAVFNFKGKSNQQREVHLDDAELVKFIKKSAAQPGYELFRYKGPDGHFHHVDSDEINEFIAQHMGENFSSKDFRTWVGSRLAVELYPEALTLFENSKKKKFSNLLIKMVSGELGNTPTVCKEYYVHPKIMRKVDEKEIPNPNPLKDSSKEYGLSAAEKLALKLISD